MSLKSSLLEPFVAAKYALQDSLTPPTSKIWGKRLEAAIENNWPNIIRKAVAAGISPNKGYSVYYAVKHGAEKSLKALIALGADVNADAGTYNFPLYEAVKNENEKMVRILLDAKAASNVMYCNESPLFLAVTKGCTPVVRHLLDAGADIAYTYSSLGIQYQVDAVRSAKLHGYTDIEKMLMEELQKRGPVPAVTPAPLAQQTTAPSDKDNIKSAIAQLPENERKALFDDLARNFSDDFAHAGKIKVGTPLQFTRKPGTPAQST